MSPPTHSTTSEDATAALAQGLADVLEPGDVVALSGDLGSGKTTFTRALAAALGVQPSLVSSPTFVFVNQYPVPGSRAIRQVVHVDAYRLTSEEDLDALGWDTLFDPATRRAAAANVALIEWPERIPDAIPQDALRITIRATAEHIREFTLAAPPAWSSRPHWRRLIENPPVRCRATGRWVKPTSPTYPFANDKARLADLGKWLSGSYTISREIKPDDFENA